MFLKKVLVVLIASFFLFNFANAEEKVDDPEIFEATKDVFRACDILKLEYVGEVSYAKLYSGALRSAQTLLEARGLNCNIRDISEHNSTATTRAQFYSKFANILEIAEAHSVAREDVVFAASRGAAAAVGSGHTGFVMPDFMSVIDVTNRYLNIGASLASVSDCIFFHVILPDGPAEKSGLLKFDVIKEIDGKPVPKDWVMASLMFLEKIEGDVSVKICRSGKLIEKPFVIKRDDHNLAYCISKNLEYRGKKFGYIYLRTFMTSMDGIENGLTGLIRFLDRAKFSGVILDLRGNSGGYISILQQMTALFFDKPETIIKIKDRVRVNIIETNHTIPAAACAANMPLVVLVDKRSYSASEVFAGIVQELHRGKIVGVVTGGSVELSSFFRLEQQGEEVGLWITTGKISLPSGSILEGRGVRPDFYAPLTKADVLQGKDAQLEAALYVLEKETRNKK